MPARMRVSEMNETSMTASADRLRERDGLGVGGSRRAAWVRSMRHDARDRPERLGQLSAAHVESIDAARAALQQTVGEAAGRGADVQADPPDRVDPEGIERSGQLLAAARDVRRGWSMRSSGRLGSTRSPGFRSRRAPSPVPTRTRRPAGGPGPASASRPSPRSTRSWSRRTAAQAGVTSARLGRFARRRGPGADGGQRLADLAREALDVEADQASQVGDRAVVDEAVRQPDRMTRNRDRPQAPASASLPRRAPPARRRRSRPPATLSSSVTTRRLPRAVRRMQLASSGLANRALMTPTDQPSAASRSATSSRAHDDRPEADDEQVRRPRAAARPARPGWASGSTAGRSKPASRG